MIEVKNLVKKYGENVAVNNLSFTVEKGQIYGFLGPNGAGKSTTMNIITGYIASTSGQVIINGHDILEEPEEVKKNIGYLPEMPPLYQEMKVGEYLSFVAELKKIKKTDRKTMISEVMELVKITDMKDRLIRNLSKGYKQRVGLAQAILGYPEVIILDEPTVGLDPKQIIEIRDIIKSLSKKHTVILSSHILSEVSAVCDYVMIISHGKLVASDTPDNLGKLARKENSLELTVKGNQKEILNVINSLNDIHADNVKIEENGEECELLIKTEENVDVRDELFYSFAQNHLPIRRMQITTMSLEDVFLELTSKDSIEEKDEVDDQVDDQIEDEVKNEKKDGLEEEKKIEIKNERKNEIKSEIKNERKNGIENSTDHNKENKIKSSTKNTAKEKKTDTDIKENPLSKEELIQEEFITENKLDESEDI